MASSMSVRKVVSLSLLGLIGNAFAAPVEQAVKGKVSTLEVSIAPHRQDDLFYTVNIDFGGQTLPLMLDTGSADIMVVSNQCNNTDTVSGCYGVTDRYIIDNRTHIVPNETFGSVLGLGTVLGNQSLINTKFGDIEVSDLATALLYYSAKGQFQNGSFSGIWGAGLRNVSRQYYFNNRLPPIDAMILGGELEQPKYSLSLPRFADPDSPPTGKLTLGGIEEKYSSLNITYGEIIDTQNYNYPGNPLAPQAWTTELQSIRVNGVTLNLSRGEIDEAGRYISDFDSGAQLMYFRPMDFDAIVANLNGSTIVESEQAVYYQCAIPQLIELKYGGQWFPIDPLDMVIPSDHGNVNGTEYCRAPLGTWTRVFGDSIIGVPFLRSVFTVFDYISADMYTKQPQIGFGSTVNKEKALSRYPELYRARLDGGASGAQLKTVVGLPKGKQYGRIQPSH